MSKQNTQGDFVRFNNAKTMVAAAMTPAQSALFTMGEELGATAVENDIAWTAAIRAMKAPADRKILRAGFVSTYAPAKGVSVKSAENRFDYLARVHAPHTSRKAKAVAKRKAGGGRKEKVAGGAEQMNASAIAQRLAAVLHYIAKAQQDHAGDSEMLEVLGEIAAIAGGAKPNAKSDRALIAKALRI